MIRTLTEYRAEREALNLPSVREEVAAMSLGALAFSLIALLAWALAGGAA